MATTYELTGAGGKGKATLKDKTAGFISFEEFLATMQQPPYEVMEQEIRSGNCPITTL